MITDEVLLDELVRRSLFEPFVAFAFLPLAYSTQRVIMLETVGNGGRMCCWNGEMDTFFDQLAATQVSLFSAPPRVWNVLYSIYQARLVLAHPPPPRDEATQKSVEESVRREILKIFGKNIFTVSTGGAPTSATVLAWMRMIFKDVVMVNEGYGITEGERKK
jgi:long-subunit acyl-CoA synthetase (AMP-forming)